MAAEVGMFDIGVTHILRARDYRWRRKTTWRHIVQNPIQYMQTYRECEYFVFVIFAYFGDFMPLLHLF